jgi:hypothetical protein
MACISSSDWGEGNTPYSSGMLLNLYHCVLAGNTKEPQHRFGQNLLVNVVDSAVRTGTKASDARVWVLSQVLNVAKDLTKAKVGDLLKQFVDTELPKEVADQVEAKKLADQVDTKKLSDEPSLSIPDSKIMDEIPMDTKEFLEYGWNLVREVEAELRVATKDENIKQSILTQIKPKERGSVNNGKGVQRIVISKLGRAKEMRPVTSQKPEETNKPEETKKPE